MGARQRRDMDAHRAPPRAGVRASRAPIAAPSSSCPGKRSRPSGGDRPRLRLGDVVQERAEAQRRAAGQLVGERLREQRAERLLVLDAERRRRIALDLDGPLEDRERVVEHVEVVVAALLDAAQRLELGEHDGAPRRARSRAACRRDGRSLASTRASSA